MQSLHIFTNNLLFQNKKLKNNSELNVNYPLALQISACNLNFTSQKSVYAIYLLIGESIYYLLTIVCGHFFLNSNKNINFIYLNFS